MSFRFKEDGRNSVKSSAVDVSGVKHKSGMSFAVAIIRYTLMKADLGRSVALECGLVMSIQRYTTWIVGVASVHRVISSAARSETQFPVKQAFAGARGAVQVIKRTGSC